MIPTFYTVVFEQFQTTNQTLAQEHAEYNVWNVRQCVSPISSPIIFNANLINPDKNTDALISRHKKIKFSGKSTIFSKKTSKDKRHPLTNFDSSASSKINSRAGDSLPTNSGRKNANPAKYDSLALQIAAVSTIVGLLVLFVSSAFAVFRALLTKKSFGAKLHRLNSDVIGCLGTSTTEIEVTVDPEAPSTSYATTFAESNPTTEINTHIDYEILLKLKLQKNIVEFMS